MSVMEQSPRLVENQELKKSSEAAQGRNYRAEGQKRVVEGNGFLLLQLDSRAPSPGELFHGAPSLA